MEQSKARLTYAKLAKYCVLFFLVWTLREFFLRRQVMEWFGVWPATAINTLTKVLVWTVPALLLVRHYRDEMAVPALFDRPSQWTRPLLWASGLAGYNLLAALLTNKGIRVYQPFEAASLIGTVLFVGITEETVFRGFLLNALLKKTKLTTALVISSVLFVLIHFPIWYSNGLFASLIDVLRSCLTIFALGCLFGYSFTMEKSLWPPILLHMVWNLAALLLFGA